MSCIVNICIVNTCMISVHLIDCTRASTSHQDVAVLDGHSLQAHVPGCWPVLAPRLMPK